MPKRHLPLIATPAPDEGPPRSPWQWVGFGAIAIFAVWVPLSALAGALAARLLDRAADGAALHRSALLANAIYLAALGLGAFLGGYLVGRWGPERTSVRQAALSGLAAAVLVAAASAISSGLSAGLLVVAVLAPPFAALGGGRGLRARTRPP